MAVSSRREFWTRENWVGRNWPCIVFLGVALIHGVAILLFTRGFLLTRSELSKYSQCVDVLDSPCNIPQADAQNRNDSSICWTKPAVDRLVIIILDALRFDFVAPSAFFKETKPWMDKLSVLYDYVTQNQSSAGIFKAIADPPTTSLQRLKGLTTGGIPTFIDIGNSFGAPAITEDNLIHQLVQNGKRVVMMGDDTWTQLFPHHFVSSYPFPSFNVKDLHTVDNGCVTNLLPALYEDNWDVLIAHFLGVDHAGHIFGVDSAPMIEKLQQYNEIIKEIVRVLENQSGPGGLHENTMLLVMGDHGQTINGDHGGGSAEEVETAIFALNTKKPPTSQPAEAGSVSCKPDMLGRMICINSIHQLDFAVTVSALLGIPFPFGSVGQVDAKLFAIAGGTWDLPQSIPCDDQSASSEVNSWMQNYVNVLCINSWQVKKYIDAYSSLSLIGFSDKELLRVSDLYAQAQELHSQTSKNFSSTKDPGSFDLSSEIKKQMDAYSLFLSSVAALARSSWTEFDLKLMGIGFCIMIGSIFLYFLVIKRLSKLWRLHSSCSEYSSSLFGVNVAVLLVLIRACSFFSNSFILEEGKVAAFLLATTVVLQLRCAIAENRMFLDVIALLVLLPLLRIGIELGQLKQAINSLFLKVDPSDTVGIRFDSLSWTIILEILPILTLIVLAFLLFKSTSSARGILKYVFRVTFLNLMLISIYWTSESSIKNVQQLLEIVKGNLIPRLTYAAGILQLSLVAIDSFFYHEHSTAWEDKTITKALALLSSWASTIILLSGKQGSYAAVAFLIGGSCFIRLMALDQNRVTAYGSSLFYALPVTQWSLLAVCLFFYTGHWCAFDGLRYASAFIGYEEFSLIRQAILLTIDTFGFSHILPICGLPLLVAYHTKKTENKLTFSLRLCQVYLIYGLIISVTFTSTMLCVILQRRHLMVWGLFAPKFVFDAVALLLTDLIIFLSTLYFIA